VLQRGHEVVDRIMAAAGIQCVSIGEERLSASGFDAIHHWTDQYGIDVAIVAPLPEMELNSG